MIISEDQVERAVHWIKDHGPIAAKAKAELDYQEKMLKNTKALLMKLNGESSLGAQEREAYASPRYEEHCAKIRDAQVLFLTETHEIDACSRAIEIWRSENANQRKNF